MRIRMLVPLLAAMLREMTKAHPTHVATTINISKVYVVTGLE